MRTLIFAAALPLLAAPLSAQADSLGRPCTDSPPSAYLSIDALRAKVIDQGYEIRRGEIRDACGEFYVLDKAGQRGELFVDPTSGTIVSGGSSTGQAAATGGKEGGKEAREGAGQNERVGSAEKNSSDRDGDD